jgi:anaerobic selenocysteine-containing dehydrogenase
VDERLNEEPDRWVQSACVLCTNGCGLDIGVKDGRIVGVRGRGDDRVSKGRLGPKGLHAWEANNSPDRLTRPLIREGGKPGGRFREATWDEAMDLIVARSQEVKEKYTAGALGVYNTGQLFIEDYYTLSVIAHAGLGTAHMDGNTRLCTATAAIALRETFGNDGQPGTVADYDVADCILHVGHNLAATQTVSWMRVLDRRRGPNPPKLVVIDTRRTDTAKEADVHVAPRVGTNVAVLNGILHLIIQAGQIDREFLDRHTVGFDKLVEKVARYTPEHVADISGVPPETLRAAADLIGRAERLTSTVLQGVYQSNQASAAACQVNNINLVRGMIGRPGCGILQSNGQPTAQNTRETGCDGEFPGFRNWQNPEDIRDLARVWNVDPDTIPNWGPPTHAMALFRLAETGVIRFLWIVSTNPAVSLPELHRIRRILAKENLFVVVQDAFLTETAQLADVVLPAAIWGEKTGTFTNFERTVHISHKAVEPPGEARSDMDIFVDYARRMGFKDKDGRPLVHWSTPEECFEAWKECTRGRPCDYTGLSYAKLSAASGIQWPCNAEYPDGKPRLYDDYRFPTGFAECGDFGHDIETGAHRTEMEYKANDPKGRAVLKAADYVPPQEAPDEEFPFWLLTGRVVHHFHTRTKTGRSRELQLAAPEPFFQINEEDAARLGIAEGDLLEVSSRRGTVTAPARIGDILPGHLFLPFHYGYWDDPQQEHGGPAGRRDASAANELTLTAWDPVSKQPSFKYAAVRVTKAGATSLGQRVGTVLAHAVDVGKEVADLALAKAHVPRAHVADYLGILHHAHEEFVAAVQQMTAGHAENDEIRRGGQLIASFSSEAAGRLRPFLEKYGETEPKEPTKLRQTLFPAARGGGFGLVRDLHALYLMASEVHVSTAIMMDAAKELRDRPLLELCIWMDEQNKRQLAWCTTQIKENAPAALVVPV